MILVMFFGMVAGFAAGQALQSRQRLCETTERAARLRRRASGA